MKLFFKALLNKKSDFISIIVINIIFTSLIFGIMFYLISQFIPIANLTNNLHSNDYYVLTSETYTDKVLSEEEKQNKCEYCYDLYSVNGKEYSILIMNEAGFKYGYPYFLEQSNCLTVFKFENVNLSLNQVYSNKIEIQNETVTYINFFKEQNIDTLFIKINCTIDLIKIVDEIENPDIKIYQNVKTQSLKTTFGEGITKGYGNSLKKEIYNSFNSLMSLFTLISIIPIIFSTFAIANLYYNFIKKIENDIIIYNIFYMSKKKLTRNLFYVVLSIIIISSIPIIFLMYLIFIKGYYLSLIFALLIYVLLQTLLIHSFVKKSINYCLNNKMKGYQYA